ncbi:MAG: dihydroneopterin aldolase [Clostridia bacterium]|nr:dihydroneopterin aldolase [Clostridia bacterium]
MDKIMISGLRVFAHHGVLPSEQRTGQPFILDIVMHADLSEACATDNLALTINYSEVARITTKVMCENTYNLIEAAAAAVCDSLLAEFPPIETVEVTIKKPRAPVSSDIEYAAVCITRHRARN